MMGFEDFLGESISESGESEDLKNVEGEDEEVEDLNIAEESERIGPTQFYGIITSNKPDWQSIIYDLIHTEQLNPWDIDIVVLTNRYFEKIHELEEEAEGSGEIDFYISSKVLLAAALLLRIKSEFLLNKSIKSIDEVLFGRKEETRPIMERIIVDENELPVLIPKTPLPRARRVTLNELMLALNKAINTESRRIKREVSFKRAKRISEINLPEFRKIDLKDRIKQFYAKVLTSIKKKAVKPHREYNQITYNSLIGKEREEKVACFLPLLHLSNNKKLWLEQENHLEEIWVYLHNYFEKNRDLFSSEYDEGLEEDIGEGEIMGSSEHPENEGSSDSSNPKGFEHVEGERLSGLEKARLKREEKKKMEEAIARELAEELGEDVEKLDKDKKIEEVSGFANED